jgi:hypothetical protein
MHHPFPVTRAAALLTALLFCPPMAGCASDAAMEKRLEAMQQELDRVQNRSDRLEERLTALEVARQKQTLHVDPEGDISVEGRPELKVVKVGPGSEDSQAKQPANRGGGDAKDAGVRPLIRATGSGEGRIENLEVSEEPPQAPARPRSAPPERPAREQTPGGS